MRVLISVDMEGIASLVTSSDVIYDQRGYAAATERMTHETNAAIDGAFAGGATEVIVNDSHHTMCNLVPDLLDPRALLIRGSRKPLLMMQGVERGCDAVLCVGYHERAGGSHGVMNHTVMARELLNLSINGQPVGELGLNAYVAGHFGVPIAMVSGDDVICAEARALLGDEIPCVQTKEAVDRFAAICRHPEAVREDVRETAAEAVRTAADRKPLRLKRRARIGFEWSCTSIAATIGWMPTMESTGARTTELTTADATEVVRVLNLCFLIASSRAEEEAPFS